MGIKKNKYDYTPEELGTEEGVWVNDYQGAGEVCMKFLDVSELKQKNKSDHDLVTVCTRILDNQKKHERFSETLERLGLESL